MDNLIRRSMHEAIDDLEPSAGVREALLARAAGAMGQSSAVGPSIPALVIGLQEGAETLEPHFTFPPAMPVGHGQWLLFTTVPLYAVR